MRRRVARATADARKLFRHDKQPPYEEGELRFYSIRAEPKEIAIESDEGLRLLEVADIAGIAAPSQAFNRHMDKVSHHLEAFYLTVAMFGCLALAANAALLGSYFLRDSPQDFVPLVSLYHWLSIALLAWAILLAACCD